MIEIEGKYNTAKVFTDNVESEAIAQIMELTDINRLKVEIVKKLKAEGREKEIQDEIQKISPVKISRQLAYVQGESYNKYLNDMKTVQQYAVYNRKAIVDEIINRMGLEIEEQFTTIHNYIDLESMILRKGAIAARKGERVLRIYRPSTKY